MELRLPPRRYQAATAEGCMVRLDARDLLSPAQAPLDLPAPALAAAIAAEWNAQEKSVNPQTMPLTQLAMTAVDRVGPWRGEIIDRLLAYLDTELICHYGAQVELAAAQRQAWQPLHDWLAQAYGAALPVTTGIQPIRALDHAWARTVLEQYDHWRLTALQQAVHVSGSFVIGLALVEGRITAGEALQAAESEAFFQAIQWGTDPDTARRQQGQLVELEQVARFLALLG